MAPDLRHLSKSPTNCASRCQRSKSRSAWRCNVSATRSSVRRDCVVVASVLIALHGMLLHLHALKGALYVGILWLAQL